ncbi:MAG TPA: tRNA (adenosine(37)-N6)-threonylcarbamoyltransferase complex dimerization subunit type 1 TsaB, partial [Clostridia bacterium]|nr:tRNA (adenosine(37)-N6)-threonylcarbamoyltransferase complex dimerization subunit type 1 TsaB [Clostridia bacterium]
MNFLFVDSCQNQLFVLLYNDGKYFVKTSNGNKKHNSVLLPSIDQLLAESGLTISEIQNIACVVGPGSFTGIRLGVTTCNGLAFATGANRI